MGARGDGSSLALTYEILTGPTHIIQKSSAWAWQGQRQQCVGGCSGARGSRMGPAAAAASAARRAICHQA